MSIERLFDRRQVIARAAMLGGAVLTSSVGCAAAQDDDRHAEDVSDAASSSDTAPASMLSPDPRLADYAMPMEDRPHERTFMQWPVEVDVYGRRELSRVQRTIASIANAISDYEPVVLLVSEEEADDARKHVASAVDIWNVATNDLWCRDSGPTFVRNKDGELAVAHIHFNGWGGKQRHNHDARIAGVIAKKLGLPLLETGLVGEQGGVEHDGAGTLLAHASCWVNPNRSGQNAKQIGEKLMAALGGSKMIWTPGLAGKDITDYHIDSLARFVAPGRILIQLPERIDRSDPYSVAAYETYYRLKEETGSDGRPLDLIILPEPVNIRSRQSDFVASYVNYYVCNDAIIAAQFGDRKADDRARSVLTDLYPGREIVLLDVDPLGESGGGIHCATQQQPKAG